MAQRLLVGPLLVRLLGERRDGQPPRSLGSFRSQPPDGVPHRPEVAGHPHRADLHPLGVPPVEFGADEVADVDPFTVTLLT